MSHSSDSGKDEPPKDKLVFPGDELAVSEEYIAGEGTLDENGKTVADYVAAVLAAFSRVSSASSSSSSSGGRWLPNFL